MNTSESTERWSWLDAGGFAALLALLTFAAHPDVALGLRSFVARDFGGYTLPLAQYHREIFWQGEWPLWNPLTRCGIPFLAQWNTMTCYPPSLIYLVLPLVWSLNFFCLAHQFWAGLGMYFLAQRWTGNRLAAAVAGVGFAFNGVTVSALNWSSIMAGLGWMPWVIWLVERSWRERGRVFLLAAGAGTLQMLSGAPEVILLTWLALGTLWLSKRAVDWSWGVASTATIKFRYMRSRFWSRTSSPLTPALSPGERGNRRQSAGESEIVGTFERCVRGLPLPRGEGRGEGGGDVQQPAGREVTKLLCHRASLGRVAMLLSLILALSAAQLIPFLDLLQHSQRSLASGAQDKWWLAGSGAANLLVPLFRVTELTCGLVLAGNQSWLPSYYPGIGLLALGLWGALGSRNWRARWLTGLLLLGFWLALGNPGGLLKILRVVFPPLNLIRFPIKYLIVAGFAAPLLAALALQAWLEAPMERASLLRRRGGWILAVLGLGIIAIMVTPLLWPVGAEDVARTWHSGLSRTVFLGAVTALTVALGRTMEGRRQQVMGLGLLMVLWLDVLTHGPSPNPATSCSVFATPGPAAMRMEGKPNLGQGRTMVSLEVIDGLDKRTVKDVGTTYLIQRMGLFGNCNLLEGIPIVEGFFPLMLAREQEVYPYMLDRYGNPREGWADFLGVRQMMLPEPSPKWRARQTARPLITSGQQPIFLDGTNTLALIATDEFNPDRMVALPIEAQGRVKADGSVRAAISEERFERQLVEFVAEAKGPSLVVIAQSYYHWWQAEVDGLPTPLWPANHNFQSLEVGPGRHHVKLVYRDRGFQIGGFISLIALAGYVIAFYRLKLLQKHKAQSFRFRQC